MQIKISKERRAGIVRMVRNHFLERHDEEIGDLKAELLVDLFVEKLGPPIYNQAMKDAHAFLADKLAELEGDFYALEDEEDSPPQESSA